MKKFLALTLSLLMVFSIIPLAIAASADESTYTKVLDFDTVLTDAVPVSTNSSNVTGGVIDYSEVDSSYTDGNVIKMAGKQWQNYGFFIGDVLQGKKVKTISYTIWSDATGTINTNGRTGISDNVSSIKLTTRTHLGLTENIATTTTPATVTYDLSALTPSLYNTIGNAILVFCNDQLILLFILIILLLLMKNMQVHFQAVPTAIRLYMQMKTENSQPLTQLLQRENLQAG